MKKTISSILLCALILSVMLTLVSCGGLSGTYQGLFFDLKFNGDKVTAIVGDQELTGTYEIKEKNGEKTISFDFIDESQATDDEKYVLGIIDSILGADIPFKEDGNKISIGRILPMTFTKK